MLRDWLYVDVRSQRRTVSNVVRWRLRRYMPRLSRLRLELSNRFSRRSVVGFSTAPSVSLTSHGTRIESVHTTIESIARGTVRPSSLTLWLDDARAVANLPAPLKRLQRRGLEIELCENFGPHTKYFPQVSRMARDDTFVTADDDIIYPRRWLGRLDQESRKFPGYVLCYRAYEIELDEGFVKPYLEWSPVVGQKTGPRILATGVSGVLYPALMARKLREAGERFKDVALGADDLWLHWVALRAGVPVRQVGPYPLHFWITPTSQTATLMATNLEGGNDRVVRRLYDRETVLLMSAEQESGQS